MDSPLPPMLAATCAVVAVSAVLRGLTGFGFSLAAVPLLSLFLPPASAVSIAVLLQVFNGAADLATVRALVEWRSVSRLSLGAIVGTPPGILLLNWLDADTMRVLVALAVCAALPALLRPPAPHPDGSLGFALPAGVLAGFFGGLAAMPGPPAITYFLYSGTPAARMRASLMIFFFLTSVIAVPGLYAARLLHLAELAASLAALPFMLGCTYLGGRIFAATGERHYRRIAVTVLVLMALTTGAKGIFASL
jgi:uncharacterized protein